MKREYGEDNNGIFSKRHQHGNKFRHHYQPTSPPPPLQLHHFTTGKCLPTSEEEDNSHSHSHGLIQYSKVQQEEDHSLPLSSPPPNDGATIEVIRRPRGRPPGSKNKPKTSSIISKLELSDQPSMSPYILELPAGVDIIESTTRFCEKRNMSLCILNGHGVVTNVTLKQPSTNPSSSTVTFHGRFDILSLSATIFASGTRTTGLAGNGNGLFTLSVAVGPQGQVVGGVVVEPLISAATIYLIAATINSPSFYRLHHDEEDTVKNGGGEAHHLESSSGRMQLVEEQCGINNTSLYNYDDHHNASDVIWAPIARQPHQIPPYNN